MKERKETIYRVMWLGFCIHTTDYLSDKEIDFITRCQKLKYQLKAMELLRRYLNKGAWSSVNSDYLESGYQDFSKNVTVIEL